LKKDKKLIVVGAGASGLYAARELSAAGYQITVLEARDRIGGRIYTRREAFCPAPIEMGAEFIHGKSPELFDLVRQAGLLMYDVTERHWFLSDGQLLKSHEFGEKLDELMDQLKTRKKDVTFREFLDSFRSNREFRLASSVATKFVEGFHAASIDRIGVNGLVKINDEAEKIEGARSFRINNGYHQIIDFLYRDLIRAQADIRLSAIVKEIRWRKGKVRVLYETDRAEELIEADQVIVTLPLGVLQQKPGVRGAVHFVPELPATKQWALHHLIMGQALKITLLFRERFWEQLKRGRSKSRVDFSEMTFMHHTEVPFSTWWTQLPVRARLLVGWVGAPAAEVCAEDGETSILKHSISSLARMLNMRPRKVHDELESWFVHDWQADSFSRGAYSYLPVHGLKAQRALIEPLDSTVFFAGEATAVGHVGTVHGAIVSAKRVADQLRTK